MKAVPTPDARNELLSSLNQILMWNHPSAPALSDQWGIAFDGSQGHLMSSPADKDGDRSAPVASLALERFVRSPSALIATLPIGICSCDLDGNIVQFNRRAVEFWGWLFVLGSLFFGVFRVFLLVG